MTPKITPRAPTISPLVRPMPPNIIAKAENIYIILIKKAIIAKIMPRIENGLQIFV
jgi:hypothetical protein